MKITKINKTVKNRCNGGKDGCRITILTVSIRKEELKEYLKKAS